VGGLETWARSYRPAGAAAPTLPMSGMWNGALVGTGKEKRGEKGRGEKRKEKRPLSTSPFASVSHVRVTGPLGRGEERKEENGGEGKRKRGEVEQSAGAVLRLLLELFWGVGTLRLCPPFLRRFQRKKKKEKGKEGGRGGEKTSSFAVFPRPKRFFLSAHRPGRAGDGVLVWLCRQSHRARLAPGGKGEEKERGRGRKGKREGKGEGRGVARRNPGALVHPRFRADLFLFIFRSMSASHHTGGKKGKKRGEERKGEMGYSEMSTSPASP